MTNWKWVNHTADIAFEVFGKNIEELFINSSTALKEILFDKIVTGKTIQKKRFEIKSLDYSMMLVDLLRELLDLINYDNQIYDSIKIIQINETELIVEMDVREIKNRQDMQYSLKAITYHDSLVKENEDGFCTVVVCDV